MKASMFIRLLRNGLFLVLVASLVLILSCAGFTQQEVSVIRRTNAWPCYIDPAVGSDGTSTESIVNLYDSLVFPNPDGSIEPLLARSWTVSEDDLTYTFELEPGVKFHNGDELTADDVVFSLERIINIGEGYGYLFTRSVEGAKALEKYKVQITLEMPFGPFLGALVRLYILNKSQVMANIQKEGPYGEYGDYGKGWLVTHDAGSGPYKVKEMKTAEYLLMEKSNDYWAGWENKDAPQYVKVIGVTEAITVRTLMSRGELEITDVWQSKENIAAMDQIPNTEVASLFEGKVLNITLHTKKPPTDDIHFRKALAYCFDYQQAINILLDSRRSAAVAIGLPGYNPNLKLYTTDLAKAEEELKQSPYYGKLDQYPFELYLSDTTLDKEKIALMFQSNAAKLGIKVNVTKSPWLTIIAVMANLETTPNGAVITTVSHYAEAGSALETRYHSNSCGTWEQGEWLQNPEIDAMIDDALSTVDRKERFQKYYAIQEKIVEICPTIWVLEQVMRPVYRSDYIVFPAVEAFKQGKPCNRVSGYNFYYRDFKVFPEKAQPPYTPFKP